MHGFCDRCYGHGVYTLAIPGKDICRTHHTTPNYRPTRPWGPTRYGVMRGGSLQRRIERSATPGRLTSHLDDLLEGMETTSE